MATYDQVLGGDYMARLRRAVIDAGLQPSQVRSDGIEYIGEDKVSVQVMDTKTRQVLYRAILDMPPLEIASPPVDPEQQTDRVWILMAEDWDHVKILDVFGTPQAAEADKARRHADYLEYIRGYAGTSPSEEDQDWLTRVEEDPDLGYNGAMSIDEWKVEF